MRITVEIDGVTASQETSAQVDVLGREAAIGTAGEWIDAGTAPGGTAAEEEPLALPEASYGKPVQDELLLGTADEDAGGPPRLEDEEGFEVGVGDYPEAKVATMMVGSGEFEDAGAAPDFEGLGDDAALSSEPEYPDAASAGARSVTDAMEIE